MISNWSCSRKHTKKVNWTQCHWLRCETVFLFPGKQYFKYFKRILCLLQPFKFHIPSPYTKMQSSYDHGKSFKRVITKSRWKITEISFNKKQYSLWEYLLVSCIGIKYSLSNLTYSYLHFATTRLSIGQRMLSLIWRYDWMFWHPKMLI